MKKVAFKLIGFKCLHLTDSWFHIMSKMEIIEGDIYRTTYALRQLGVTYRDIEKAILTMETEKHNVAEFDRDSQLICTRKAEV